MTTAYTSLLGLALPVTGELSGTWGDTVNTAITSLLDTAIAGTTSITTDADITLSTTTGASNQARQAIILWNPASGTVTRNITAPAQSKMYVVINASGGTQSIVIRGVGPTTGVTIAKGESATVAWNGSDFVKVSSSGGALTLTDLTVTGNTILGDAAADTLTVNATSTFASPVSFQNLVRLPSTGRSAAAALTVTAPAFLYGVASTYTDTTSSGTIAAMAPFYSLSAPTLSTSNVTTYSFASTLYVAGAPAAGGSATITNPYALYVNSGANYFAGATSFGSTLAITGAVTLSGGTANGVLYLNGSKVATSGTALVFDGNNLGVAVTPSAWNSTTARAIQVGNVSSLSNYNNGIATSTAAILSQNSYYPTDGSPEQYLISGTGANKFVMVNGEARWYTAGSGTAGNNITFTQPMTLNASGLFGLGSASPTSRLYVVSSNLPANGGFVANFSTDSADTARMGIYVYGSTYSGGSNFSLGANSMNIQAPAGLGIVSGGTSPIVFGTDSTTEWARFTTPGNFGLGCTPTNYAGYNTIAIGPGSSIGGILQFQNTSGGDGAHIRLNRTGSTVSSLTIETRYGTSAPIYFGTNGTTKMVLQNSGTLSIGNTIDYGGIMLTAPAGSWNEGIIINPASSGYSGLYLRVEAAQGASYTGTWALGKNASSTTGGESVSITKENLSGGTNYRTDAAITWSTGGNTLIGFNLGVGVTAPTAKLQVAGTATNGTPFIKYDVTSANSSFNWVDTSFASNMTANTNLITFIGREGNLRNSAYFGFKYVGAASNSNLVTLGLYGVDNILNVNGTGNVSLYGATTTADGVGITFPASQSPSSDANCLDDYEEGTWTPAVRGSSTDPTVGYAYISARYVKIGSYVWVQYGLKVSSVSGGSGEIYVSGLPFTSSYRGAYQEFASAMQSGEWSNSAYAGQVYHFVQNSSTSMGVRYQNNADTNVPTSALTAATYINCEIFYQVA